VNGVTHLRFESDSALMNRTEVLFRFESLKQGKQGGAAAPHKPLLILYALGRLRVSGDRFVPFKDVDEDLRALLSQFSANKNHHPEYPFWRLQNDGKPRGIWQVTADGPLESRKSNTDAKKSELLGKNAKGGFTDEIYEALREDSPLLEEVTRVVLHKLPAGDRDAITDAVESIVQLRQAGRPIVFAADTAQELGDRNWTQAEINASVVAYLNMLKQEDRGEAYSKKVVRDDLLAGDLRARSGAAIEYRMQNISAVLRNLGHRYIDGYKPATHVGSGPSKMILAALLTGTDEDGDFVKTLREPTQDRKLLANRADVLAKTGTGPDTPKGNRTPKRGKPASGKGEFVRDPEVRAAALRHADGCCELCQDSAPFVSEGTGRPYLEVHHVVLLAENGPDTIDNCVAVCPNCHMRCHHSEDRKDAVAELYRLVPRLEKPQ